MTGLNSIYPLHIVAYDNGTVVRYTIENRLEGTVCCARDDGCGNIIPRQWDRVTLACEWLMRIATTRGFTTLWVDCRPVFDGEGWLQVPKPPSVPLTPHQEYQHALELDVG